MFYAAQCEKGNLSCSSAQHHIQYTYNRKIQPQAHHPDRHIPILSPYPTLHLKHFDAWVAWHSKWNTSEIRGGIRGIRWGGEGERGWAAASECHLTLALDLILWQNQLQHNFECQPNGKSGWKDICVYISLVKSGISRGICVPNRRQVYFGIQDSPLNSKGSRKWQSLLLIK